jgi:hypothetical protein
VLGATWWKEAIRGKVSGCDSCALLYMGRAQGTAVSWWICCEGSARLVSGWQCRLAVWMECMAVRQGNTNGTTSIGCGVRRVIKGLHFCYDRHVMGNTVRPVSGSANA